MRPSGAGWEPIDVGESGAAVYRRGDVFAKCSADIAELAAERDRIAWLAGTPVPGASVVDWQESTGGACLVTSAVPGVAGVDLPASSWLGAMESLGRAMRELHSLPGCPFERPLASVIAGATDVVRRGAVNPEFLTDEWRAVTPESLLDRVVAESPYVESVAEPVVCHGDACLPNVFFDPVTLRVTGFIDLGRLGVADRYADLALTTIQLYDEWSVDPGPFLAAYGLVEPDHRRLDFFRLLDPLTWG
ncbi:aminoglycoside 3'-phosphotransferase [Kribbella sandramycini]|uniref:Aminoglycoside 3'-phosphotransferase n=1 Tax=Kribbella sandramycini TaxID=60450 RepID=A0A7Y4L968_9ACTN|nr:aminoglycoside 3'-phosphotransferase [Kribbella sandramycini]MBB6566725.1 streptomycin 3'-kinase [Kribbella sandramycini]NOL45511.1 aminoglycoside 3'-phosphotransferase [Kribbella sandramycini]